VFVSFVLHKPTHTPKNIKLKKGFSRVLYQVKTDEAVAKAPKPPATCGNTRATINLKGLDLSMRRESMKDEIA
jgi:hypothetical protein